MTSNQHKAYDVALVAGEAAQQRLSNALWDYDIDRKTIAIGRPQADYFSGEPPYPQDERTVVLYAPTWEGDRPAASYGSVKSHGESLAAAILKSASHRLIYRPHPRSGVIDPEFGAANQRIISAIREANQRDPHAHHVYDDSASLGWQLSLPDIAICDISAMIYDRLATGKPLLVTRPVSEEAVIDVGGYLSVCEWLSADQASAITVAADTVLKDDAARDRLKIWSSRYFGDTSPGAPTHRFQEAIETLLHRAESWKNRTSQPDWKPGEETNELN